VFVRQSCLTFVLEFDLSSFTDSGIFRSQIFDDIHFVSHDNRGNIFQVPKLDNQIADRSGSGRIKSDRRLVKQNNLWIANQGASHAYSLPHSP